MVNPKDLSPPNSFTNKWETTKLNNEKISIIIDDPNIIPNKISIEKLLKKGKENQRGKNNNMFPIKIDKNRTKIPNISWGLSISFLILEAISLFFDGINKPKDALKNSTKSDIIKI